MREVLSLNEENYKEFFANPKLRSHVVFIIEDKELEDGLSELSESHGWEIEKFDPSPDGKWKSVLSLYPQSIKDGENIVYNTTKLTDEAYAKAVQRIKDEHNIEDGDIAIYRNKSDDGFLWEKRYKVLRVIPIEHMSNSSSDCAEVELETPYKRHEHPTWADMGEDGYKKWNDEVDEHNETKRGTRWFQERTHIGPDDLHHEKQITTMRTLTHVDDFDGELTALENSAYDLIQEANKAIDKATFSKWFEENKNKFKLD